MKKTALISILYLTVLVLMFIATDKNDTRINNYLEERQFQIDLLEVDIKIQSARELLFLRKRMELMQKLDEVEAFFESKNLPLPGEVVTLRRLGFMAFELDYAKKSPCLLPYLSAEKEAWEKKHPSDKEGSDAGIEFHEEKFYSLARSKSRSHVRDMEKIYLHLIMEYLRKEEFRLPAPANQDIIWLAVE